MSLPQEPLASILNLILLPNWLKISSIFASSSWLSLNATFHFMVTDFPILDCLFLISFRSEIKFSEFKSMAVLSISSKIYFSLKIIVPFISANAEFIAD